MNISKVTHNIFILLGLVMTFGLVEPSLAACVKIRQIKAEAVSSGIDSGAINDVIDGVSVALSIGAVVLTGGEGASYIGKIEEASSRIKNEVSKEWFIIGADNLYVTQRLGGDNYCVWPVADCGDHDGGYRNIDTGQTRDINASIPFRGKATIQLWEADAGADDSLGKLIIPESEQDTKYRTRPVISKDEGSVYLVGYQVYPNRCPIDTWNKTNGRARGIGIGGDRSAWILGTSQDSNGNSLVYKRSGSDWKPDNGAGIAIDVSPGGTPWVINRQGGIYYKNLSNNQWTKVPGQARGIGIGGDRSVWVLGWKLNSDKAGYPVYRWNGSNWDFKNGYGVAIDVAPGGTPWIINKRGEISYLNNNQWTKVPGKARDIGIGGDSSVWIVGWERKNKSGFAVYQWNRKSWDFRNGHGVGIDVAPGGTPWIFNQRGEIFVGK